MNHSKAIFLKLKLTEKINDLNANKSCQLDTIMAISFGI